MKWTILEAWSLINEIKNRVEPLGFSVAVTGGVLFKGYSEKDLDLVFYPMNAVQPDYARVISDLRDHLSLTSVLAVKHPLDCKLVFSVRTSDKRRIDLFFPGYRFSERVDGFSVAGEVSGSGGIEES